MRKRQKECVIRTHRYNREKNPEKFYHGKLMLFLPWRNEDLDIIAGNPNYATRYRAELEHIMEMEAKYSKCAQTLDEAVEVFNQYSPPEHAWQNVAPTAEQERIEAETDGLIEERYQDPQELDEHADLIEEQNMSATEVSIHKQIQK